MRWRAAHWKALHCTGGSHRVAQVFATDTILTTLMCATRSVYSWDIIITRTADALYLDKRDPEVRLRPQYRLAPFRAVPWPHLFSLE